MTAGQKIDLKKLLAKYYKAGSTPEILAIPGGCYVTLKGRGAPGGEAFQRAIGAVYAVAYTLKFELKGLGRDFVVAPLEGFWWVPQPETSKPDDSWRWKLLIQVPDFVTEGEFATARAEALARKGLVTIGDTQFEKLSEGLSAQVMHVGPYDAEGPTVEKLMRFVTESGMEIAEREGVAPHIEIYLSDPNRVPSEKLRTIIRIPVARKAA